MGKSSINGSFSMAMLNNQMVMYLYLAIPTLKMTSNFLGVFPTLATCPTRIGIAWRNCTNRTFFKLI